MRSFDSPDVSCLRARIQSLPAALSLGVILGFAPSMGFAPSVWADPPVLGSLEFQISSASHMVQTKAKSAADAAGNFVVVWESFEADGDSYGILGRRFASDGTAMGDNFVVNAYTTSLQVFPDIVMRPSGEFVVIWQSAYHDDDGFDVYARRFDSLANPLGPDLEVNPTTVGDQHDPAVSLTANGGFLVIWDHDDGADHRISAQQFDSAGNRTGNELLISSPMSQDDFDPRVELRADGSFITTWERTLGDGSGKGVFAQLLTSDGAADGSEFPVNVNTAFDQENPEIAPAADGSFAVTWQSQTTEGAENEILFRIFNSDGSPRTGDLQVNVSTTDNQIHPMISPSENGFVIVWESETGLVPDEKAVLGRCFDSQGQGGGEFQVNELVPGNQYYTDIAATTPGRFIVAWTSDDCSGCANEVKGRVIEVSALFVDGFESGDTSVWTSTTP